MTVDADEDNTDDAGEAVSVGDIPVCPTCHRLMDDVATMAMPQVLEGIREELARSLLRGLRDGTATHQEMAIARGLLRDSGVTKDDGGGDDGFDGTDVGPSPAPPPPERHGPSRDDDFPDFTGTEGG